VDLDTGVLSTGTTVEAENPPESMPQWEPIKAASTAENRS